MIFSFLNAVKPRNPKLDDFEYEILGFEPMRKFRRKKIVEVIAYCDKDGRTILEEVINEEIIEEKEIT